MTTQPTPLDPTSVAQLSGGTPNIPPAQTQPVVQQNPDAVAAMPSATQNPDGSTQTNAPAQPQTNLPAQTTAELANAQAPPSKRDFIGGILAAALAGMGGSDPSKGSGFLGGVGNGAQIAQQMEQQKQQAALEQQRQANANRAADDAHASAQQGLLLTKANTSIANQRLGVMQQQAKNADFAFSKDLSDAFNSQMQSIRDQGGELVGHGDSPLDAIDKSQDPKQLATWHASGELQSVADFGPDGKLQGVDVYHIQPDMLHSKTKQPMPRYSLGLDGKGNVTLKTDTIPAGVIQYGQLDAHNNSVLAEYGQWQMQQKKNATDIQKAKIKANAKVQSAGKGENAAPNLSPQEYQTLVDGIANYQTDPRSLLRYGKAFQTKLYADARLKNPQFDETRYNAYNALEKSFTEGANATKIQSFNALIGHTADMMQGVDSLRNTGSPWINTPINKLKRDAAGSPAVSQVMAQIMPARTEFLNFLNNNHALKEEDVAEGRKLLNENMSPAQFEATAKQFMRTSIIRLGAINQTYKGVRGSNWRNILSPQSQQALRNAGFGKDVDALTGQPAPDLTLGQTVTIGGKQYKVTGFNAQGKPVVGGQ